MSDEKGSAEACVTEFGCDRWPLHYACRTGNLKQVKYMIDTLGFDYDKINEADDHNSTPLYHAALIGNTEICRFLLQRGAICTENDSARVFYVALTPSLRSILREWSLSAANVDPYLQSLQQNFTIINQNTGRLDASFSHDSSMGDLAATAEGADCIVHIWDIHETTEERQKTKYRSVTVHRIMLKHRCPHLFDKLEERFDGDIRFYILHLNGNEKVHCDVILRFIEYLYIGKIEVMTLDMAFLSIQVVKDWKLHCDLCVKLQSKIDEFILYAEQQKRKNNDFEFHNHVGTVALNVTRRNTQQSSWSRTTNPVILASFEDESSTITELIHSTGSIDPDKDFLKCTISNIDCLHSDMKQLARHVANDVRASKTQNFSPQSMEARTLVNSCSDLTILCHSKIYHVHRFRLIQHSEYFLCALKGNFIEATTSTIDLSSMIPSNAADALPLILQWMYADCFLDLSDVTIDVGIEVLHICSALLCSSRLFNYVVNTVIAPNLSVYTVFHVLHSSRLYPGSIDRLEMKCCEVIASNLEEVISNDKAAEDIQFIIANEITATRQGGDINTTDIPLVAEIRRAINRLVSITVAQRLQKLDLLKAFVENISRELQRDL